MTAALLAEPEPAIRGYLERQLQSDGFHVLNATFGGEALARRAHAASTSSSALSSTSAPAFAAGNRGGRGTATSR